MSVQLNANTTSGAIIATDDISGVSHQLQKIEYGDSGSATQISEAKPLPIKTYCITPTTTSVNDSATSITLLALNTSRKGATIYNDSSSVLYLLLGATASTTNFTVKMNSGDYYEIPFGFVGRIDGIWASAAGGAARITELT